MNERSPMTEEEFEVLLGLIGTMPSLTHHYGIFERKPFYYTYATDQYYAEDYYDEEDALEIYDTLEEAVREKSKAIKAQLKLPIQDRREYFILEICSPY